MILLKCSILGLHHTFVVLLVISWWKCILFVVSDFKKHTTVICNISFDKMLIRNYRWRVNVFNIDCRLRVSEELPETPPPRGSKRVGEARPPTPPGASHRVKYPKTPPPTPMDTKYIWTCFLPSSFLDPDTHSSCFVSLCV